MKPGSVVVDLAAETGGNVEGSVAGEVVRIGNAQVWGGRNVPRQMPGPASKLYAQNVVNLLTLMTGKDDEGQAVFAPDFDDEIVAGAASPTTARSATSRPARRSRDRPSRRADPACRARREPSGDAGRPTTRRLTSDQRRRRLADDLRAQRLRRHRGDLQGVLDAAHAADVGRQRDPRVILLGAIIVTGTTDNTVARGRRAGRDRARRGQHGRWLRGDRPDAADVRAQEAREGRRGRRPRAGPPDADLGPAGLPGLRRSASSSRSRACPAPRPPATAT